MQSPHSPIARLSDSPVAAVINGDQSLVLADQIIQFALPSSPTSSRNAQNPQSIALASSNIPLPVMTTAGYTITPLLQSYGGGISFWGIHLSPGRPAATIPPSPIARLSEASAMPVFLDHAINLISGTPQTHSPSPLPALATSKSKYGDQSFAIANEGGPDFGSQSDGKGAGVEGTTTSNTEDGTPSAGIGEFIMVGFSGRPTSSESGAMNSVKASKGTSRSGQPEITKTGPRRAETATGQSSSASLTSQSNMAETAMTTSTTGGGGAALNDNEPSFSSGVLRGSGTAGKRDMARNRRSMLFSVVLA